MLASQLVRRAALLAVAAALIALAPAFGKDKDENWVATWATALVIRPAPGTVAPPPAGPPPAANAAGAAGGPPRAPPPPMTVQDQTLREIVHTSIGGERVRVV